MIKKFLALAALAGSLFAGIGVASGTAQAQTCDTRVTTATKTTAAGTWEHYHMVTRTCGASRSYVGSYAYRYRSGETATVSRTESYKRVQGAWVVSREHEVRVAHYTTGRVTTTRTDRVGCYETRVTTSVSGTGTRTTTTSKMVC